MHRFGCGWVAARPRCESASSNEAARRIVAENFPSAKEVLSGYRAISKRNPVEIPAVSYEDVVSALQVA